MGEFLGEHDPENRDPHRARRPSGRRIGGDGAAQPRGVPRRGPRLLARPGGAHAPRIPRVRRRRRGPRQTGVVTGAALRGGLGEGHDDPCRQRARIRSRLRAWPGQRPPAQHDDPAQSGRAGQVDGLRAPGRRLVPPSVRRQPVGVQEGSEEAGGVRGTADRLRRHDTRSQNLARDRCPLVRGEPPREGGGAVPPRAQGLGHGDEARHVGPGRRHRRGEQPDPRIPRAVRPRLARSRAPRGSDAVFPEGWRHAAVVASDDGGVQESSSSHSTSSNGKRRCA